MTSEQLIALAIQLILGAVGAPTLFDWLKKQFGFEGTTALVFVVGLSAAVGVGALLISGELGFAQLTWENLPQAVSMVFSAATIAYKLLNKKPQS